MSRRRTKRAKPSKKDRLNAKDQEDGRKFIMVTAVITVVLLILIYFIYNGF